MTLKGPFGSRVLEERGEEGSGDFQFEVFGSIFKREWEGSKFYCTAIYS